MCCCLNALLTMVAGGWLPSEWTSATSIIFLLSNNRSYGRVLSYVFVQHNVLVGSKNGHSSSAIEEEEAILHHIKYLFVQLKAQCVF